VEAAALLLTFLSLRLMVDSIPPLWTAAALELVCRDEIQRFQDTCGLFNN